MTARSKLKQTKKTISGLSSASIPERKFLAEMPDFSVIYPLVLRE
jgi:hypothetical protein